MEVSTMTRNERFIEWVNMPVYRKVRRIDLVLFVLGSICTVYYGIVAGWTGAVGGLLTFIMFAMIGLWFL
jgi:hypothetical protein